MLCCRPTTSSSSIAGTGGKKGNGDVADGDGDLAARLGANYEYQLLPRVQKARRRLAAAAERIERGVTMHAHWDHQDYRGRIAEIEGDDILAAECHLAALGIEQRGQGRLTIGVVEPLEQVLFADQAQPAAAAAWSSSSRSADCSRSSAAPTPSVSVSTCRSPSQWPTTPSVAGRTRCSATPTW